MKKMKLVILGIIMLIIIMCIFIYNRKPLNNIYTSDINEIFIYYYNPDPVVGYYVDKEKDISDILKILKSIILKDKRDVELKEVDYTIYINLKNRDSISIGLLPDNKIVIGNEIYSTDKDYHNKMDRIMKGLSVKYKNILNNLWHN